MGICVSFPTYLQRVSPYLAQDAQVAALISCAVAGVAAPPRIFHHVNSRIVETSLASVIVI